VEVYQDPELFSNAAITVMDPGPGVVRRIRACEHQTEPTTMGDGPELNDSASRHAAGRAGEPGAGRPEGRARG
jgi:hypothetical protein